MILSNDKPDLDESNLLEASIGIKNSATATEANSENTTVRERSPKICPAIPSTNTIGKKTAIVVRVDAKTAVPTSLTPLTADSVRPSPSSLQRNMLSSTTMELSTSIPTPRASPPNDIMLSETLNICIGAKVATIDSGIATAMIRVEDILRKNTNKTTIARNAPNIAVFITSSIALFMKIDWSLRVLIFTPFGIS